MQHDTQQGVKEIISELDAIARYSHNAHTVFSDWLDIMLFALQRDDENYLSIVNKYKGNQGNDIREVGCFCKTFATLLLYMQKTNEDLLGQVYMQWNMNNKFRGQYFTPPHIASMMAQMVTPSGKILDPCCGSGVMLVEAIKIMTQETIEQSIFFGQDIDINCVKMCALNFLFFNVDGFVVWGDSLAMACNKVYQTKRTYEGGIIKELKDEELEKFTSWYGVMYRNSVETPDTSDTETQEVHVINQSQLTLF